MSRWWIMPVKKDPEYNTVKNGEDSFKILLEENKRNSWRITELEQAVPNLAYRISRLENQGQTPYQEAQQYHPPIIEQPQYKEPEVRKSTGTWEGVEDIEEKPRKEIKKPNKRILLIGVGIIIGLWLLYIINGVMQGRQIILPF